jgi:hypothetical protein
MTNVDMTGMEVHAKQIVFPYWSWLLSSVNSTIINVDGEQTKYQPIGFITFSASSCVIYKFAMGDGKTDWEYSSPSGT